MIPCNILAKIVDLEINGEPFYFKRLIDKIQRGKIKILVMQPKRGVNWNSKNYSIYK